MQKCVTENESIDFRKLCNDLLNDGWKVIPGTVSTSIAMASPSGDRYCATQSQKVLVAFFEK